VRFPRFRGVTGVLATVALTATLAGCSEGGSDADPTPSGHGSPSSVTHVDLTLGVYGESPELKAYRQVARAYERENPGTTIEVRTWAGERAMVADVSSGSDVPDLFLASRAELPDLVADQAVRPVDDYLDARGIALGETYSRQALEDFSTERRLQCMPYAADPTVLYYNTDLVDFSKLSDLDVDPPEEGTGEWSLDQFEAALKVATRPGPDGTRHGGIYVQRSIGGLAPWIEAAGGHVFDDPRLPTRMTLSDGDSRDALERIMPILTKPRFRLSDRELAGRTPLQAFTSGRLAMMTGKRSLVPQLRTEKGLSWDVMAMPTDGGPATTGDFTGLCLSEKGIQHDFAADFLAYLISEQAVTQVAESGYTVPANQAVAYGPVFQAKKKLPKTALAFIDAVADMRAMPSRETVGELDAATSDDVAALFTPGVVARIEQLTTRIDSASDAILDPPTAAPSGSPSPSESP